MTERTADDAAVTARVSTGRLRGAARSGVARFLGVPYAAAPTGRRRFAHPEPPEPWEGVREAVSPGPTAPQLPYEGAVGEILPSVVIPGEDFLHVNVWAPEGAAPGSLPVLVWFHGGALTRGANALAAYDGTAFARDGVVFVAVNYRLGSEGFSVLDGAPLNLGLADQLAALRWVSREIAAFGGDPGRVTAGGQSAGASTTAALAVHPEGGRLMRRAILQSGPLLAAAPEKAGRITRMVAEELGITATREAFAATAPEDLVAAQHRVASGAGPLTGGPAFSLAVDGDLVPRSPYDALRAGAADHLDLLMGATSEEHRLWMAPTGMDRALRRPVLAAVAVRFGIGPGTLRRLRARRPGMSTGMLVGAVLGEVLLERPTRRVADARARRGAATHVYEFGWRGSAAGLGAAHCMELPFVFDRLGTADAEALTGPGAPQDLAGAVHGAWVEFVRTGDPGWPVWTRGSAPRGWNGS
ncbi:carboxylesterase family protein [Nocardiopsis sp. CT-R113]|uniref:Carboxylesterase family protein n=1 Tax=Nocardiopsis codii TaxID=3065942 RepID=A0ABU7K6M1_9ACTN|nr:carboxylesterase family protein [Nocardiopsis sp. CT-R113]MEE2037182.1 carboxylesterase family protein [Nocardiopsis sp. CT-R113]